MRTIEEFRARHLETLSGVLHRPGMWSGGVEATADCLLRLLRDLVFIDEREAVWETEDVGKYMTGNRGVVGHFAYQFKGRLPHSFVNEVASAYAEIAFYLGYFTPARLLTRDEMSAVAETVEWRWRDRNSFYDRDWPETELRERFGPPSHEVVGGDVTVACYGCEDHERKWVFIDYARTRPGTSEWLPVRIARDVRPELGNTMYTLPFAAGWWGDNPPEQ
jgi:hypothetical protein